MKPAHALLIPLVLLLASCTSVHPIGVQKQTTSNTSAMMRSVASSASSTPSAPPAVPRSGSGAVPETLLQNGMLQIGQPGARHVLLVWTNHDCRYCRNFQEERMPRLLEDLVRAGTVQIVTALLPLQKYPWSSLKAAALFCAGSQGKGSLMHGRLFAATDRKMIFEAAESVALDLQAFAACVDSKETVNMMEAMQGTAAALGVKLVPTFFLDGERFVGLPDYPELRGRIRQALDEES